MWLGPNLDLSVQRNAVLPIGFQLTSKVDGNPISLATFTISCGIKQAAGSGSIIDNPVVTINNASLGLFDILFDGRNLSSVSGSQGQVALAYEVLATDDMGPQPILRGTLYLIPGVI